MLNMTRIAVLVSGGGTNLQALINAEKKAVRVLPIFDLIQKTGSIPERDMFNTYNMGVGMSIVVSAEEADKALSVLKDCGEDAYVIGHIEAGEEKITIC